ncbi:MAG: SDR family oxidoreductase [Acidobacteriota bacterium]
MTDVDNHPIYLILGATGAVGSALARRLSERGARVVVAGRRLDALEALADEVAGVPLQIDARDFEQVAEAFTEAKRLSGRLCGAVNCVGSILLKPAHLTTAAEFEETIATNLGSAFATVRSAARAMRRNGGSVVLVSSAAASIGLANHEAIAAAKAGIEGLVRAAATTYAHARLRVNAVAPGLVDSAMSRRIIDNPKALETSLAMHPLGRVGRPEEIATLIEWLLGPEGDWVTGQIWGVDGGLATVKQRTVA